MRGLDGLGLVEHRALHPGEPLQEMREQGAVAATDVDDVVEHGPVVRVGDERCPRGDVVAHCRVVLRTALGVGRDVGPELAPVQPGERGLAGAQRVQGVHEREVAPTSVLSVARTDRIPTGWSSRKASPMGVKHVAAAVVNGERAHVDQELQQACEQRGIDVDAVGRRGIGTVVRGQPRRGPPRATTRPPATPWA